ncbi:MAG TPA: hypothetical protein VEC16_05160 [Alphaproteobacteria bacterium]|nr:hypothetical protein [Alphaproteobacteria bacterium]
MSEENSLDIILFQAITEHYNKLYPDRFAPGVTPSDEFVYVRIDSTKLADKKELEDAVFKGAGIYKKINLRTNPEYIEQKYYHNGMLVDWENLEESNFKYMQSILNCNIIELYKTQ